MKVQGIVGFEPHLIILLSITYNWYGRILNIVLALIWSELYAYIQEVCININEIVFLSNELVPISIERGWIDLTFVATMVACCEYNIDFMSITSQTTADVLDHKDTQRNKDHNFNNPG